MKFWSNNFKRYFTIYYWQQIALIFVFAILLLVIMVYQSVAVIKLVKRGWMPVFSLQNKTVVKPIKIKLSSKNLFGSEEKSTEPDVSIILRGIIMGRDDKSNLAIINVNGQETVYQQGEKITDDMRVDKVLIDRVILLDKSVIKTLMIPQNEKMDENMTPTLNNID